MWFAILTVINIQANVTTGIRLQSGIAVTLFSILLEEIAVAIILVVILAIAVFRK